MGTLANIEAELISRGHGSRAVVGCYGKRSGHAFNMINHNGTVFVIDGQTGRIGLSPQIKSVRNFKVIFTN